MPERIGEVIGAGLLPLAFLIGVIKCVSIMRRPIASKLCVLALLLIFIALLIPTAVVFTTLLFPVMKIDAFTAIAGILCVLLMIAALVVGIVGLATYDGNRFQQGRGQAVWAVVLGGLAAVGMVAGIAYGAVQAFNRESVAKAATSTGGEIIKITEFNFSVEPGSEWADLDPKALNKLACVALRKRSPESFCMVLGERLPVPLELHQLAELVKSNLDVAAKVLEQSEETVELNGLTFMRVNTKAFMEVANLNMEYEHWIATQRGFSWQIVFWTPKDKAALSRDARKVMETFRILDPELDGAGTGTLEDVGRPELGFRTKLAGLGWAPWTDSSGNALMEFRAQRGNEALVLVPLRFGSEPPDLKALTRGLLSTLDFENTADEDFRIKPWTPGHGGTGSELEIERDVDGTRFHYILRVARTKESAHLVGGWIALPNGDLDLLRRSMDSITLSAPEGSAPPLNAAQEKALGLVFNEIGFSLTKRNQNEAAAGVFHEGFKHGNDPTVLGNAGDAFERAEMPAKGVEMLAPHMENFPEHEYLGLRFARLQVLNGNADGGEKTFLSLVENGMRDESDLLSWLQLLNENEHYPAALRCVNAWVKQAPTGDTRRWQAQTYNASGNMEKALAILERLYQENPDDRKAAFSLGETYNDAGNNIKAAEIAESLLIDGNESPRALMILGWSQMGRKRYRDAKATFERAAKGDPDDEDIQDAIRRASAALGQGDNSAIKEPIALVALPEQVAAALGKSTVSEDFGDGYPAAWLMRATGYHFEKGKPLRQTTHRRVKILTADGARDFSTVEFSFKPLSESIFMNRLEVRDASGKSIARAKPGDAYVRDLNDGTASNEKVLHMQVAGVRPGTTVEWEITRENLGTSDTFPFERHLFANRRPVAGEAVFVTGDVEELRFHVDQGKELKEIRAKHLAAWVLGEQPVVAYEPFSLPEEQRLPVLWLGGNEGSWKKIGQEYLERIKDRLVVDQTIRDLAAKLVDGKTTERDKISAIARHVQKEIAYKAIEFGVRALRPNTGQETLGFRYGDCKDIALLTHLLLKAAGIENHLALIDTAWGIQPGLPSLDQFNHMVVHVPSLGENNLLDATDKSLSLAGFPADGLWHSRALVLDPAGPCLVSPPAAATPDSCRVSSTRSISIDGNDWQVEETLELAGYYGAWMRAAFTGLSSTAQREKAQDILSGHGSAQVHDFRFENLDKVGEPARVFMSYAVPDAVTTINGKPSGVLPAFWEDDYLETKFVKNRKTPFEVIYPLQFSSEAIVKLPSPPTAEALVSLAQKGGSEHLAWSLKTETRKDGLVVRLDFKSKAGIYPPASYGKFHDGWESARRAMGKPLSWEAK